MQLSNLTIQSTNRRSDEAKNVRRGSALLVVLGMLAFMLFSGLAFSVYMRQSRLPTSFLRRTASTRQLTKAALAEAIDHIDRAIGNDPHPGVRLATRTYDEDAIDNIWNHRVFFGLGSDTRKNQSDPAIQVSGKTVYPEYAETDETVPTLTLEGLAYLPPNLINEARYYSQRTPTAKWHAFWFDSGRYAYTAIDVSDYFDVNRMFANKPRAATASQRITLAHLFEEGADHSQGAGTAPAEWDKWLTDPNPPGAGARNVDDETDEISFGGRMPFASLADFNLTFGNRNRGSYRINNWNSPFYDFIKSDRPYDCGSAKEDNDAEKYRGMTFVTDGWFPTTTGNKTPNTNREKRDLTQYQPFREADLIGSSMPSMVNKIMSYQSEIVNAGGSGADLSQHLCLLGLVQLWDYLDPNRVPVSLAAPTLERVPMIVGIEPIVSDTSVKITCEPGTAPTVPPVSPAPASTTYPVTQTFTYKISLSGSSLPAATVLAAYPFRSHGVDDSASFSIDGRIALFLTVNGQEMSLRPGTANESLHLTKDMTAGDDNKVLGNAIFSIALQNQSVKGTDITQDETKPVKRFVLQQKGSAKGLVDVEFFKVVYKWNMVYVPGQNGNPGHWDYQTIDAAMADRSGSGLEPDDAQTTIGFKALASNGAVASEFSDATKFAGLVDTTTKGIDVKLNAAVWAWVKCNDEDMGEKIVDLVPACVMDDDELNGAHNSSPEAIQIGGKAYPLMRYDVTAKGESTFNIKMKTTSDTVEYPLAIANPRIICNDPRYNHQPENWYALAGSGLEEQNWLDETAKMVGQNGCDGDFYMFTSDAGRMQSVYELAFLPRFTGLSYETKVNALWGNYLESQNAEAKNRLTFGSSASDALDYKSMWRTYRCYDVVDKDNPHTTIVYYADPFEEIGLTCGENGPKVNPYSDSTKVLAAAFANTPHDWRLTTTDKEYAVISDSEMQNATSFNKKHAWNDYSSDSTGKMCWDCVEAIAKEFKAKVRKTGNWEDAFAGLVWDREGWTSDERKQHIIDFEEPETDDFTEAADSPMYSVDKKFLYGFWHDSFAARQQLFLIFVRAEPMMMGGGVQGQIPPQLGARAVALVWRDPTATSGTRKIKIDDDEEIDAANPHRTRILFYHQFD